jgi:hypothetical protein
LPDGRELHRRLIDLSERHRVVRIVAFGIPWGIAMFAFSSIELYETVRGHGWWLVFALWMAAGVGAGIGFDVLVRRRAREDASAAPPGVRIVDRTRR